MIIWLNLFSVCGIAVRLPLGIIRSLILRLAASSLAWAIPFLPLIIDLFVSLMNILHLLHLLLLIHYTIDVDFLVFGREGLKLLLSQQRHLSHRANVWRERYLNLMMAPVSGSQVFWAGRDADILMRLGPGVGKRLILLEVRLGMGRMMGLWVSKLIVMGSMRVASGAMADLIFCDVGLFFFSLVSLEALSLW